MFRLSIGLLAVALLCGTASMAKAQAPCGPPKYLLLQSSNLGQGQLTPGRTYSYCWFGACPTRSDRVHHRSYYNSYWEWEVRRGR